MKNSVYHKTLNNAVILSTGAAIDMGLQFVFVLIAGRQLGPVEFGYYGYLLSILMLVLVIAHFGLQVGDGAGDRAVLPQPGDARARDTGIFAATFRIRALFSWLALAVALTIALLTPLDPVRRWAVAGMFAYLLFVPFDLSPLLDAYKLSRWDVPGRLAGRLAALLILIALWRVYWRPERGRRGLGFGRADAHQRHGQLGHRPPVAACRCIRWPARARPRGCCACARRSPGRR